MFAGQWNESWMPRTIKSWIIATFFNQMQILFEPFNFSGSVNAHDSWCHLAIAFAAKNRTRRLNKIHQKMFIFINVQVHSQINNICLRCITIKWCEAISAADSGTKTPKKKQMQELNKINKIYKPMRLAAVCNKLNYCTSNQQQSIFPLKDEKI